jgi:hypothetical protein
MQIELTSAELFTKAAHWEIVYITSIVIMIILTMAVQVPVLNPYRDLLMKFFLSALGLTALGMIQNGRLVAAARAKRAEEQKG